MITVTDTHASADDADTFIGHPLDREDINALYGIYWERLYAVLSQSDLSTENIEDAINDAFALLLADVAEGKPPVINSNPLQFLIDRTRYRARRATASHEGSPALHSGIIDASQRRPLSILVGADRLARVNQSLEAMTEIERQVYTLYESEHLPHKEIATRLGISPDGCRQAYGRAMDKMRVADGAYAGSSFLEAPKSTLIITTRKGALQAIQYMPDDARDLLLQHYVENTPREQAALALGLAPDRHADRLRHAERLFKLRYGLDPEDLEAVLSKASSANDV